jgi:hypothetical protein
MSFCLRTGVVASSLVAVASCGSGSGGGGADATSGPALVSIAVEPAEQTLIIDGTTPATATYTATGTYDDGHREDVSDRASFTLSDPGLGAFAAARFTSTLERGGRARVVATLDGVEGEADLLLRLRQRYPDPASNDLPADPAGPFDGPDDAARAPELVYPSDGVLVPPNLRRLELHFRRGAGNELFELSFQNDLTDVVVYARCTEPLAGGCIFTPDPVLWRWLADTNRGGQGLVVRARGTDDQGTGVGTSAEIRVSFSHDDIKGGIYYWKAAGGAGGSAIMRFDFGDTAQTAAERFAGPEKAGGKCVGCHALSRDGTKMVAPAGGWDVEGMLLLDTASGAPMGSPAQSAFASWNPDGSRYVGVFAYQGTSSYDLLLFDGNSGGALGTIEVGGTAARAATHPDWSPDGSRIVFTRTGKAYDGGPNNQRFFRGDIEMVVDAGGGAWGSPIELVAGEAGVNSYYPSFAPDGQLIAFNRSTCPAGDSHIDCNGDSDPTASIYVMTPEAGAPRVALARVNAPGPTDAGTRLTSSWPRWAPFEFQRTDDPDTRLVWLTFSSTRNYGLRTPPDTTSDESLSGSLLWMAAVDPERAAAGEDPSYPAFCLPFQDLDTSNHIAQWTEEVVDVE